MLRIGIVVQRYGVDVVGGAESLARDIAKRLNAAECDVTVFTTTAKDYITWANHYPPGDSILDGVNIKRYPVEHPRDIEEFNRYSGDFFNQPPDTRDEMKWIRLQGPYSPALLDGLRHAQKEIDVFLFFTYLYYTTVEGMMAVDKPAVLFPTAHDEPPFYLEVMKKVFQRPEALFFLTGAEMELVKKTYPPGKTDKPDKITSLVRTGIDIDTHVDVNLFKHNYLQYVPYLVYAGRIEKGKGLEPVFEAYHELRKNRLLHLVLMGKKLMDFPRLEGLKYVGFVSEKEKLSAFKGAVASIQPSPLESLSITTLESFSQHTPVLVNHKSAVLREHIDLSGGGFAYEHIDDFIRYTYSLYDNRGTRNDMGRKGFDYVDTYFSWNSVIENIKRLLYSIASGTRGSFEKPPLDPAKLFY